MSMRGLRIAYLMQHFPPEVGAGPARAAEMARYWRDAGADVTVVTSFPARVLPGRAFGEGDPAYRGKLVEVEEWEGIRVLRSWLYLARRSGFAPTIANNLSFAMTSAGHALARLGPVDVLIASSPPFFPHLSGALISRVKRIPLVLEIRDLWPDYLVDLGMIGRRSLPGRGLFALERWLLRRADEVVVVTDPFKRRIESKGVSPDRITVIPNGVDLDFYKSTEAPPPVPALVRRTPQEFLVGYVGNFGAGQGLGVMAGVAAMLKQEDPSIRLVLAGDGPEREPVVDRILSAGVDTVTIQGPIQKAHTPAFYAACDACLVPLAPIPVFQETIPSKIFEVMACERPVVGCLGGEGRRLVEESGGGVVAPPGDARGIADAILSLRRADPAARRAMGASGRAYVAEHYQRRALAGQYLELLERVVRRSGNGDRSGSAPGERV